MKNTIIASLPCRFIPLVLSLAAAAVLNAAQTVQILNDGMSSPNYNSFSYNSSDFGGGNPDDTSDVISSNQGAGGNPGAYLEVMHTFSLQDFAPDSSVSLQSIFEQLGNSYTPSGSGNIYSLAFSIDIRTTGPFSSVGFTVNDSGGGQLAAFTPFITDGNSQTVTVSGLVQSDFDNRDFSGGIPLSFGFSILSNGSLNDSGSGVYASESYTVDVDNFIVTATLVPEPSSLVVFGMMGLGLVSRRSRR